jgi:AmpE protein
MTLISIIICLALERWQGWLQKVRNHNWLVKYASFIQRHVKTAAIIGSWPGLLVIGLPVIFVTALIQIGLHHFWYAIPAWIFNTVVLLYCLGSHNLYEILCQKWCKQAEAPIDTAAESTVVPVKEKATSKTNIGHTLSVFNRDVFAVIFWFCLFGATGALTYRAITIWRENAIMADSDLNGYFTWLTRINDWIDWIPARLLGLSFALAGDFIPAFQAWIVHFCQKPEENEVFFKEVAAAALKHIKPVNELAVQDLAFRSLVVWVIVLAIMTLTAIVQ